MSSKNGMKFDLKKILLIILAVAVIAGVATGKLSLADLFGQGAQTSAVTESTAVSTESPAETQKESPSQTQTRQETQESATTETAAASTEESLTPMETAVSSVAFPTVPTKVPKSTAEPTTIAETTAAVQTKDAQAAEHKFRNKNLLDQHYEKHGEEMGFPNAAAYQKAASDIINAADGQDILYKYKSDGSGDRCFYVEATKEFVVLSYDGSVQASSITTGSKSAAKKLVTVSMAR